MSLRLVSDCLVGIDDASTPGYLGAASSDGVLRTDSTISYTDGGNYVTLAVSQAYAFNWTGAHTWGASGTGVNLIAYSDVAGDDLHWVKDGNTGGGGKLSLDGNSELEVVGKTAFGTATMGGTYGYTLISAQTSVDLNIGDTAAAMEFLAELDTTGSSNGLYGFQTTLQSVNTVSNVLDFNAHETNVNANHTSGTITKSAVYMANWLATGGGVTTRAAAFRASPPGVSAGSTIGTWYYLYCPTAPTAASTNWNIWLKGGNSRFGDDNAKTYWGTADDGCIFYDGTDLVVDPRAVGTGAFCIGVGSAGVDYKIKVNGETNDGTITWMEDEDYWQFDDDVHFTEAVSYAANSPAQITSNQNDYNFGTTGFARLSSDASRNITGLANGRNGRILYLVNVGSNNIVIQHENASSTAANRVICLSGADTTLAATATMILIYDATSSRWREMA